MGIGSPGYYVELNIREEIEEARRHCENALQKSGIGDNHVLTSTQRERIEDAYAELGKALRGWNKYPNKKKRIKKRKD